jgi:hypothetical protein
LEKRGSLISESERESIGTKKTGGATAAVRPGTQNKIKIGLAAGLLVVASLILAYHFGMFDSRLPADYIPPPPELIEELERQQQEMEEMIERGEMEAPASS